MISVLAKGLTKRRRADGPMGQMTGQCGLTTRRLARRPGVF